MYKEKKKISCFTIHLHLIPLSKGTAIDNLGCFIFRVTSPCSLSKTEGFPGYETFSAQTRVVKGSPG